MADDPPPEDRSRERDRDGDPPPASESWDRPGPDGADRRPADGRGRDGWPTDAARPPPGPPGPVGPALGRVLGLVAGTMLSVGVLVGVTVFVLGTLGGPELGLVPSGAVRGGERALVADYVPLVDRAVLAYSAVKVGGFVAVALAPVLGVFVGVTTAGDRRTHLAGAGLGAFVGGAALVAVTALVASTQAPPVTAPPGFRPVTVRLVLRPAQLAVNAALVGLLSGVAAAGGTVLGGAFRDGPAARGRERSS